MYSTLNTGGNNVRLSIKQQVFSWNDKFSVKDENGNDKYYVEGEFFSWGKKLHVYDLNGKEVIFIQQKVFSFLPRFFVFVDGEEIAEIVKEFTFFKPVYSISGLDWTIEGDFWSHDYQIIKSGNCVVSIRKEWFTWGDSYALDIEDPKDEIPSLAVVLAIDCVMAAANTNASSANHNV